MAKRKKKDSTLASATPLEGGDSNDRVEHSAPPSPVEQSPGEQEPEAKSQGWVQRTQADPVNKDEPDRRPTYPDPNVPFSIAHDNQAGVKLLKSDRFKQVQLAFSSPISGDIEGHLTAAGWKFRPQEKIHTKQYGENGAAASIEEARRFYNDLVDRLITEKGAKREMQR